MLLSRILTALILLPLAIAGILFLPTHYFALAVALIFILGAHEWTKISAITSAYKLVFIALVALLMFALWRLGLDKPELVNMIIPAAVVFWLCSIFFIVYYPRYQTIWSSHIAIKFIAGILLLIPSWYAMVLIKNMHQIELFNLYLDGGQLLLIMMVMIWLADTGAYFSGKKWGKTKLIPDVSPGKTWQGAFGAIIVTCLTALTLSLIFLNQDVLFNLYVMLFTIIIVITSIIGDLFESMYKRNSGIKDSGNILPGHGGVLDRIDSLTSVAPIFYLLIYVLLNKVLG